MLTFVPRKISEDYKKVEFYRVNKELCDNELYKDLNPTAILLYTLLCDRLSISYANENKNNISKKKFHYYDEEENVYVIFTRIDLEKKLHVGKSAISSAFKELNKANLIKEIKQGKNKPNKIYIGKTISEINKEFINVKFELQTSGSTIFSFPEVGKSDTNKNNIFNLNTKYNSNYKKTGYQGRDYSEMDWSSLYANLIEN